MSLRLSTHKDLQCTHCGFTKSKLDLYCYFAWNDGIWSDMRHIAPNQAVPALVQYCPQCNRFYYIEAEGVYMTSTNDYNWIEPVDYAAILPSVKEYDGFAWSPVIEYNQRLCLLWAYNDHFFRNPLRATPSEEDKKIAKNNILALVKLLSDPLIIAELLREAEEYDLALRFIADAEDTDLDDEEKAVLYKIKDLALNHNNRPFKVSD